MATNTDVLAAESLRVQTYRNHNNAIYDAALADLRLHRATATLYTLWPKASSNAVWGNVSKTLGALVLPPAVSVDSERVLKWPHWSRSDTIGSLSRVRERAGVRASCISGHALRCPSVARPGRYSEFLVLHGSAKVSGSAWFCMPRACHPAAQSGLNRLTDQGGSFVAGRCVFSFIQHGELCELFNHARASALSCGRAPTADARKFPRGPVSNYKGGATIAQQSEATPWDTQPGRTTTLNGSDNAHRLWHSFRVRDVHALYPGCAADAATRGCGIACPWHAQSNLARHPLWPPRLRRRGPSAGRARRPRLISTRHNPPNPPKQPTNAHRSHARKARRQPRGRL